MAPDKTIELVDLSSEINHLIQKVNVHEVSATITSINSDFDSIYEIKSSPNLKELLNGINSRLRKIQTIYHVYFEDLDDQIINGNAATLPLEISCEFYFDTNSFVKIMNFESPEIYKELIDNEFQTFVLTTASIFENIVRLIEILGKKVIIHKTKNKPLSMPLGMYLDYLSSLLRLNYLTITPFIQCIQSYEHFFNMYLETINLLRNAYIHGYKTNLLFNSNGYMITLFCNKTFSSNSPQLELKVFTQTIVEQLSSFISDLITTLINEVTTSRNLPF
ncbi:hypothetical protein JOE44_002158 [Chryseobacterium sp. PvR013]|uniref:hypothetical protein n=1 Tax=Chryseobacterium sp. PvR013 TaxID=2806595 RepID=UPI001AEB279C|nr:hypothetical protein [Chryseobacterium sp. PvR013]MBP1165274.1 hypothetical protein [Chryseobacterium sp. PvR013]